MTKDEEKEFWARRLRELLYDMDVPVGRYNDYRWLSRNLGIRNSKHDNFKTAMKIIKKIYFSL